MWGRFERGEGITLEHVPSGPCWDISSHVEFRVAYKSPKPTVSAWLHQLSWIPGVDSVVNNNAHAIIFWFTWWPCNSLSSSWVKIFFSMHLCWDLLYSRVCIWLSVYSCFNCVRLSHAAAASNLSSEFSMAVNTLGKTFSCTDLSNKHLTRI